MYPPQEDSFLLEREVKRLVSGTVLDMGTGSGILARAAAEKGCDVTACDIDPRANTFPSTIKFIQSDLFENIIGTFDWILFNPPYLPDDPRVQDIALDGGPTGRELLDTFLSSCKPYLSPGGKILLVQSSLTGIRETQDRLTGLGFSHEIIARQKIPFEELVVFRAWLQ